jgi:aryl-alcohol dehydrogenase-like predicted oxidoreductase
MSLLNADGNPMRYNPLGATGLMVSELSFGIMSLFEMDDDHAVESSYEMLQRCYRGGVNLFDCAESYGDAGSVERVLGEVIRLGISKGTWGREDLVITTKLGGGGRGDLDSLNSVGLSRKHLVEGMRASLARLQLDYVDLVLAHRPDPRTPMVEIVRGMNFLIDQGLAFHWGTSEWSAQEIEQARSIAKEGGPLLAPPLFDQCSYDAAARSSGDGAPAAVPGAWAHLLRCVAGRAADGRAAGELGSVTRRASVE